MKILFLLLFSSVSYAELQALDDLSEYRITTNEVDGVENDASSSFNEALEFAASPQVHSDTPDLTSIPEIGPNESITRESGHTHFVPSFRVEFQSISNSNF